MNHVRDLRAMAVAVVDAKDYRTIYDFCMARNVHTRSLEATYSTTLLRGLGSITVWSHSWDTPEHKAVSAARGTYVIRRGDGTDLLGGEETEKIVKATLFDMTRFQVPTEEVPTEEVVTPIHVAGPFDEIPAAQEYLVGWVEGTDPTSKWSWKSATKHLRALHVAATGRELPVTAILRAQKIVRLH